MKKSFKIALITSAFLAVTTVSATYASNSDSSESVSKALVNQLVQMVTSTREESSAEIDRIQSEANAGNLEQLKAIYSVLEQNLTDEQLLAKTNEDIYNDIHAYAQSKAQEGIEAGQQGTEDAVRMAEEMIALEIAEAMGSESTDLNQLLAEIAQLKATNGALRDVVNNQASEMDKIQSESNQAQQELDETVDYLREQIQMLGETPVR